MLKNWQNSQIYQILTVFWPKRGLNVVRFQFWDQIWNPLILAHLSDPKIKENRKFDFLDPYSISKASTILRGSLHLTDRAQISYTVFWYHKTTFETWPLCTFQKKLFFTPPYYTYHFLFNDQHLNFSYIFHPCSITFCYILSHNWKEFGHTVLKVPANHF